MSTEPRFPPEYAALAEAVRAALTDELRGEAWRGSDNRFGGYCDVASEAFYYLAGGKSSGWKPIHVAHEAATHWWLIDRQGRILDLTREQFRDPFPYAKGQGGGFLTREPSKRAQVVIERVKAAGLTGS